MIVFGVGRPGRTSLGIFLPWPLHHQVSTFTSGRGGVVMPRPSPDTSPALGSAVSVCPVREGRRLTSAACGDLLHQWILARSAIVVPPFS